MLRFPYSPRLAFLIFLQNTRLPSERWSLLSITFPPGKNSRTKKREAKHRQGMRVPPRHLAQLPVHMLGIWDVGVWSVSPLPSQALFKVIGCRVVTIVPKSILILEPRSKISLWAVSWELLQLLKCNRTSTAMVIYILPDLKLFFPLPAPS